MLKKTIEINKNLLPSIQKQKLEKPIQMRIMKRMREMKSELKDIEEGNLEGSGDETKSTDTNE